MGRDSEMNGQEKCDGFIFIPVPQREHALIGHVFPLTDILIVLSVSQSQMQTV